MNSYIFRILSKLSGEISFTNVIPTSLAEHLLPNTESVAADFHSGQYLAQEIKGDGFSCWHHTILFTQDDSLKIMVPGKIVSLNFCLQNSFLLFRADQNEKLTFHEGQFNMSFLPEANLTVDFHKEKIYKFLTIFYLPEKLSKLAHAYFNLALFLKDMDEKKETSLFSTNQFTTSEMKKIIFRLIYEGCKDAETNSCIKNGRAMEILTKVTEHIPQPATAIQVKLNKHEIEKIFEARSWLGQQVSRSITLFELSRKVGLNVHKLSSGFFQITGTTIFHYQRKLRMTKAIQLLEETDRGLFDIGTEVGYIDGKTFSKEFKKEKGMSPLEFRKQTRCQFK